MTGPSAYDVHEHIRQLASEHLVRDRRRRLTQPLATLAEVLAPEETILKLTDADHDGLGLLVITDERTLFLDGRAGTVAWSANLDEPVTVEVDVIDDLVADLLITTGKETEVFEGVGDERWARELARLIEGREEDPATEVSLACPVCDADLDRPVPEGMPCPVCGIASGPTRSSANVEPAPDLGPVRNPDGTATCPFCAEAIQPSAVVCRWCNRSLDGSTAAAGGTNGLAIASLVLGILWLYWVGSILALVFGYIARGQIARSRGRQSGAGIALAGIVLGWLGLGILVAGFFVVAAV